MGKTDKEENAGREFCNWMESHNQSHAVYHTVPIGNGVASWAVRESDLTWGEDHPWAEYSV